MGQLLIDYLPLVIFIAIAFVICTVLLVVPMVIAVRNPDPEKVSAYECGFDAFDDSRMKFDVRFYLVSLLFIIFDLEVHYLRSGSRVPVSLGRRIRWTSRVGFLGHDRVPRRADRRVRV